MGLASAAAKSTASPVSVGSRASRPPRSSYRLSGTRNASPGAGLSPVRTSSVRARARRTGCRPTPRGRAQFQAASAPGRSAPRADDEARPGSAGRDGGASTARRETTARARVEPQRQVPRAVLQGPRRLVAEASKRDLEHGGRRRVEPLDIVERDKHGTRARSGPEGVEQREPDRAGIRSALARLGEEQRDLQRAAPQRSQRVPPRRGSGRAGRIDPRRRARPRPRRSGAGEHDASSPSPGYPLLPQNRLADPWLAGEDKRAGPSANRSRKARTAPSSSSRPITAVSPTA